MKPLITVSDEARDFLLLQLKGQENYIGVKVALNQKGCAGGEYEFSIVRQGDDISDCDQVEDNGVTIIFPRTDLLKLIGAELTVFEDKFNKRLDFNNPNEASRCGCGESISFTID
jgi:iron-sulfur cluster assembly protein